MFTPLPRLLLEALVVAGVFVALFLAVDLPVSALVHGAPTLPRLVAEVAVAAALFHLLAEYTGVNAWYCAHRP